MRKPSLAANKAHKSLPIQSFAAFDTVYSINSALTQLELGNFRQAAILSDATGRDDRITAVTATRVGALLAANLDVKPADDRAKTAKYAEMFGGTEDAPGRWDRAFQSGMTSKILKAGLHMNFGLAEILWSYEDGILWPRLKYWHTQFVRWDVYSETYRLMTADQGEITLPRIDEETEAQGQWFIWCPFGYRYAWLDGMIRGLAPMFMRRMWNNRDWARYNEVHGLPITKAIAPGSGGSGSATDDFFDKVANRGSEPTILLQQGAEGNKFDVELLEAVAQTYETFKDSKTDVNIDIAVLMLGQNLTTEATGGGLGDGGASTHNLVRLDKAKEDAAFAGALYEQVLKPWARFNFGDAMLAPRPMYRVDPPDDEGAKTLVLKGVGDGIKALQDAKVPVNVRATSEEFGILLLTEEEEAAANAVAKEEAQAAMEAMQATGGQEPGGKEPPPAAGGAGKIPPKGPPKIPPKIPGKAALGADDHVQTRYQFAGLPIAVENPRGSTRTWQGEDGKVRGSTVMLHDYGFIEGHMGSDGEELDCYVGPDETADNVHVVHQLKAPEYKKHDEDKLMLGFGSSNSAKAAFLAHRNDGEKSFGGMSVVPLERFKDKLQRRTGTGKIRASAPFEDNTFAAIMALSDKGVAQLRARTAGGGKLKRYPDKLTARAVVLGARALAVDLAAVKAEIKEAESFKDLEKRLVAHYRDKMDPEKFARLVQRTRLMANLTGRLTVVKGA